MGKLRQLAREAVLTAMPGVRARLDGLRVEVAQLKVEVAQLKSEMMRLEGARRLLEAQRAHDLAGRALLHETLAAWLPIHPLRGPRVTHRGLWMAVHKDLDVFVSECIRQFGIWEPVETDCMLDALQEGDHFIDIGANIGYYAVLAGDLVGKAGRVFAFEPDPRNFDLLRLNRALNGLLQVEPICAAVSDAPGEARLHRNAENLGDHRLNPITDKVEADSVPVTTRVLDMSMLAPEGRRTVVKIDTQGWEARIILGNHGFMAKATQILFEWCPRYIDESGCDPISVVRTVEEMGFALQMVDIAGRRLVPLSVAEAEAMMPALRKGKDTADDPIFQDIVATRR